MVRIGPWAELVIVTVRWNKSWNKRAGTRESVVSASRSPQGVVYGVAPFRSLVATRTGVCAGDEAGNFWVLEHERAVSRPEGPAA